MVVQTRRPGGLQSRTGRRVLSQYRIYFVEKAPVNRRPRFPVRISTGIAVSVSKKWRDRSVIGRVGLSTPKSNAASPRLRPTTPGPVPSYVCCARTLFSRTQHTHWPALTSGGKAAPKLAPELAPDGEKRGGMDRHKGRRCTAKSGPNPNHSGWKETGKDSGTHISRPLP